MDYKVWQRGITNYDRFWITKCDKTLKIGSQSAIGLQGGTSLDYKLRRDYKARWIAKWYSTRITQLLHLSHTSKG